MKNKIFDEIFDDAFNRNDYPENACDWFEINRHYNATIPSDEQLVYKSKFNEKKRKKTKKNIKKY